MKTPLYITTALSAALFAACENADDLQPALQQADDVQLTITAPTLTSGAGDTSGMPSTIDVIEFVDGHFSRQRTINPSEDALTLATTSSTEVYCVSGVELPAFTASSTLDAFKQMHVSSPQGAQSAPMFFVGSATLTHGTDASGMTLELTRGVARIDLACLDERIKISEVTVVDAPASSALLSSAEPADADATVSYTAALPASFEETAEQLFTLFESSRPVTVKVRGTLDGSAAVITTTIAKVQRNKIYTLNISGGSGLEAAVTIAPWQAGDKADATAAYGSDGINLATSVIPQGVKINRADNSITVSPLGAKDLKISFLSPKPVTMNGLAGGCAEMLTVEALTPVSTDSGYISSFLFNVAAQPKCAQAYDATLFLKGVDGFHLNIDVEASPYQVATVRIGGHDWMCFNAISSDPEEQIYLSGDMTVESMYNEHFVDCIGNYFQYGKPNPFSPWIGYDPEQFADQPRDIPWRSEGKMPLPKGFHPATMAEWTALIPNNTTIPASYMTPSGDSIKATVVTLPGTLVTPSAATNAKNYKMRYVLFESITTGARLYVPIAGLKSNNNAEVPGMKGYNMDVRTAYWMADDRLCWLIDYKKQPDNIDGAQLGQNRWHYDGFLLVRGVKD